MAALTRPTTANYQVHESVQVDTQDNEDHTFCGIMFPIKAKKDLPVHQLIINSVAVRGQLGPMTVWVSNREAAAGAAVNGIDGQAQQQQQQQQQQRQQYEFPLQSRHWTQIFKADVKPSRREYATLDLSSNPIVLHPGEVRAIYIHSASPGDEGVVYDNSSIHPGHWHRHGGHQMNNRPLRASPRYQDGFLAIHSARAHLSPRPFGQSPIWGWGNAWREHREFVGQIQYGIVFALWNPEIHSRYFSTTRPSALSQQQPPQQQLQQQGLASPFGDAVLAILACQRRWESPWSKLPDECIYYILNMCRYDWFGDTPEQLKTHRRQRARRLRQSEAQAREDQEAEAATDHEELAHQEAGGASSSSGRQHRQLRQQQHQQDEEMFVDAQEEEQPREAHVVDNVVDDDDDVDNSDEEDSDVVMSEEEADDEGSLDDDDDEEESEEEEEEEEVAAGDDDDDDDADTREWHRAHGYHPPHAVFAYEDISSGEEEENDDQENEAGGEGRPGWIQRHLARVSLLRAMAGGGGGGGHH